MLLLFLLTACQSQSPQNLIEAKVIKVFSGQSIEVLVDKNLFKVRLSGINAPDVQQNPWGIKAKNKLNELLIDKNTVNSSSKIVFLETDINRKDKYDRIFAYLWQDDILINKELIAQGYVLADLIYTEDQYVKSFRYAQDYARMMGYGIWDNQQPMQISPQEFRQQKKFKHNG